MRNRNWYRKWFRFIKLCLNYEFTGICHPTKLIHLIMHIDWRVLVGFVKQIKTIHIVWQEHTPSHIWEKTRRKSNIHTHTFAHKFHWNECETKRMNNQKNAIFYYSIKTHTYMCCTHIHSYITPVETRLWQLMTRLKYSPFYRSHTSPFIHLLNWMKTACVHGFLMYGCIMI